MDKIDFKQIRKLPPEQKIKVLQRIEDELHKLIEERKKEIDEKNTEVEEAESLLEEARRELTILEEIQTPELKKVEIEKLFGAKEKEGLESIAATARTETEKLAEIEELSRQPMPVLYRSLVEITDEIHKTGIETAYQHEKLEQLNQAFYEKRKAIEHERYTPPQNTRHLMTRAEQIMENYL